MEVFGSGGAQMTHRRGTELTRFAFLRSFVQEAETRDR